MLLLYQAWLVGRESKMIFIKIHIYYLAFSQNGSYAYSMNIIENDKGTKSNLTWFLSIYTCHTYDMYQDCLWGCSMASYHIQFLLWMLANALKNSISKKSVEKNIGAFCL